MAAIPGRSGQPADHAGTTDPVRVELVSAPQHESLVDLLCELHAYYHSDASVPRDGVRTYLVDTLLAADSPLRLVVATDAAGAVLGFAAISLTYSLVDPAPDKRRHCWLKELYVRTSTRSRGVGSALMAWVARYAVEHGCARIDWPVQAANARGQAFYEGLGATQVVERLSYRLAEPGLSRLAGVEPKSPQL
ncbi:MAG: GNAT family N-acetyltransferase [Caldimonas sp.]